MLQGLIMLKYMKLFWAIRGDKLFQYPGVEADYFGTHNLRWSSKFP
jgi:hypothetical protein